MTFRKKNEVHNFFFFLTIVKLSTIKGLYYCFQTRGTD